MDPTTTTQPDGAPSQPAGAYVNGAPRHDRSAAQSSSVQPNGAAQSLHEKGRTKIPWSKDVWERIDKAVELEMKRTRIGARFLPKRIVPPKTTSVPTDSYTTTAGPNPVLTVDEGATTRLNEYYVEFELTPQQVDQEEGDFKQLGHSTAVTLATKAANMLAQAEDLIIFQGVNAINHANPFTSSFVLNQGSPADTGLLNQPIDPTPGAAPAPVGPLSPPVIVVQVQPLNPPIPGVIYGPNTFEAVSQAYSLLQAGGHYGPYALVLQTTPYADTYAPLPAAPTLTADRIEPLVAGGFFGAGTLPPNPAPPPAPPALPVPPGPPFFGVLVSLGGNTMHLVTGLEPIATFMQEDTNGNFRFRVLERFALRVKDTTGIIVLQFN